MKLKLFLLLAIIIFSCQFGFGQAWSGILDPSRATDWTEAGIPGGIPNRTTICATVAPSGLTDATDMNNIDNAIASCPANQVVQLEAGTYTITGGLTFDTSDQYGNPTPHNNVTLRGAGPDKTKLEFTGVTPCGQHADVCILGSTGWSGNYKGSTTWTAGYAKGTTVLTVGSTTGMSVGQIVVLDQRDDAIGLLASPNGTTESGNTVTITTSIPHGYKVGQSVGVGCVGSSSNSCNVTTSGYDGVYTITAVPSITTFQYADSTTGLAASGGGQATVDTGGVYISCVGGPTCSNESGSGTPDIGRTCPDSNDPSCATGEISYREQMEFKRITAINGDQLTIDPPIENPNWRASQSPGVWWSGNYITGDGIESMTLDYTNDNSGSFVTGGISFYNAYECWAKNVRSISGNRNHVWLQQSARIDVVDNYFWGTKGGHSKSYGVESYNGNSDNLVQNNICQHVVSCVIPSGDWGSVYGYNYMVDSGYNVTDWLMGMQLENHDFTGYDLFEGNDSDKAVLDDVHGDSAALTAFRNRLRGQDTPARSNNMLAADDNAFNRFANFVGNVMGTTGAETSYQVTQAMASGYIWEVGAQADKGGTPNDPLTASTLLRWGNYDVVNNAPQWNSSEIPAALFTYINGNIVPATHILPNSLYLSSQPAFWKTSWGTPPWPAIGPDVTGGTAPDGVGGYAYAIPSQLCYENTPVDSAYQQKFAVTGASWSSGTATLTIGSNTLVADDTVTVSGVSPSGYDGTFAVTAETSTTISYALPTSPGTYTSGGTVAYPNILLFNAANCYPAAYAGQLAPPSNLSATVH